MTSGLYWPGGTGEYGAGLPGAGPESWRGSPALSQSPGPRAPDYAKQAARAAGPDSATSSRPVPVGVSLLHDAPMITRLLQAERDAWLARDSAAIARAREATNQALAKRPGEGKIDAGHRLYLRAAVQYWRRTGHLEVPTRHIENLEGGEVPLGRRLETMRAKETATTRTWTNVLNVLGMRWHGVSQSGGVGEAMTNLAVLVRAEDNARRNRDDDAADTASQEINKILGSHGGQRDSEILRTYAWVTLRADDLAMLRAAIDRWRAFGTLDPRPGGPAGERLDRWLEDIRLGRFNPPPPWLRAVLGALGLNWPPIGD